MPCYAMGLPEWDNGKILTARVYVASWKTLSGEGHGVVLLVGVTSRGVRM